MRYNKALDLILASALAFKAGQHAVAAEKLALAAEEDDFQDAVDVMDATNEDAVAEDEATAKLKHPAQAAFAAVGKRLQKRVQAADASNDVADVSNEDLGDGDLPASGESSTDTPERRGEEAVAARLARAERNRRVLSARK